MGQALAARYPVARETFEKADDILGFSLSKLCFEGPDSELNDTINTQAAIYVTSIATLRALRAGGYTVKPAYVAGHSLGEYSAYAAAGVFSFEDGLRLVRERGRLMKKAGELNPGGMAAILKLDDDVIAHICREVSLDEAYGDLQVANYNAPGQIVISGHNAAVERGMALAKAAKARKTVKVPISIAAHSELMRVVADDFRAAVDKTPLNLPEMPIIANISAEPLSSLDAVRAEMEGQLTASVHWTASVQWLIDHGITQFVEIGPKNVLAGLIRRIDKGVKTQAVNTPEQVEALLESET